MSVCKGRYRTMVKQTPEAPKPVDNNVKASLSEQAPAESSQEKGSVAPSE